MKLLRKILLFIFDLIDELFHQKRIKKFIEKEKILISNFIDVGAFKGKYTDLILKMNNNCKILMIEPQKKYYSFLKEKYNNNNQIEISRIGLSKKKELLDLRVNKHEITSTFSKFNEKNRYLNYKAILFDSNLKNMTTSFENVQVYPLSQILEEKNIRSVDLIKIDTEGHEYEVLIGIQNFIKRIKYILIEFHIDFIYENYNSDKMHNYLTENNFKLLKKFNFPFTTWEDRLYKNLGFNNNED